MYKFKAKVVKVVDGDTFDVIINLGFDIFIKERVRLYNFNAYESSLRDGQNQKEKEIGIQAREFCKKLLQNKGIILESIKYKKGKYGRILCNIYYDKRNISDILTEKGFKRVG